MVVLVGRVGINGVVKMTQQSEMVVERRLYDHDGPGGVATAEPDQTIVIAYAKVVEDKEDGVYMTGVYFGGIANTKTEAEKIARDCVNTVKGGTIFPRLIYTQHGNAPVIQAMEAAAKRFHQLELQMFQAEEIMERTGSRTKSK
jgi:hypothetical protein